MTVSESHTDSGSWPVPLDMPAAAHHSATVRLGALFNEVLELLLDIFRHGALLR